MRAVSIVAMVMWMASGAAIAAGSDPTEPDDLPPPQPEIASERLKGVMPGIPAFELPAAVAGVHGVRELRIHGRALLGHEIKLAGYVSSIYDCAAALAGANPRASRAELLVAIDNDPRRCDRPRFYLGDTKASARELSITVVDVPRPPAKPEREASTVAELAAWPQVPHLIIGDYVVVTGTWLTRSPHGDSDTHGLLVYKALAHIAAPPAPAAAPSTPLVAVTPQPAIAAPHAVVKPPLRPWVPMATYNASIDHLNACSRAIRAGRYDEGIAECEAATKIWPGNHLAWYGAASGYVAKRDWEPARAAIDRALALRPERAMYQLYDGIARYEAELARVQGGGSDSADAALGPSRPALEAARAALLRAIQGEPRLWRAHSYLARVDLDLDDARLAAEQLSQAIETHAADKAAYIALSELYRRWDYPDQALAIAQLGVANVPANQTGDLWYEAGMADDANGRADQAIQAFSAALAADGNAIKARFQRGQLHALRHDDRHARADLERVLASTSPDAAALRSMAAQLLAQLARVQQDPGALCQTRGQCITDRDRIGNQ